MPKPAGLKCALGNLGSLHPPSSGALKLKGVLQLRARLHGSRKLLVPRASGGLVGEFRCTCFPLLCVSTCGDTEQRREPHGAEPASIPSGCRSPRNRGCTSSTETFWLHRALPMRLPSAQPLHPLPSRLSHSSRAPVSAGTRAGLSRGGIENKPKRIFSQ